MTSKWITVKNDYNYKTVELYIENGKVMRGANLTHTKTLYPYKYDKKARVYVNISGTIGYNAFIKGFREGLYSVK